MTKRPTLAVTAEGFTAGVLPASGGGSNASGGNPKPTIVMVHGAWHWGGCFQLVASALANKGYPVVLPDLKSHGDDEAGYADVVDMADYTASVKALLDSATEPVILLGHSMGGVTLTYLAERYPTKIRQLIYLTAFMTPSGVTANDYIFSSAYASDPAAGALFQILAASADGKGVVLDTGRADLVKEAFYGDCSAHDVAIAAANIIAITPGAPYVEKSSITTANFGSIPRVFIECTDDHAIPIAQQRKMQADVPGAKVLTLETSHSPFFSQPDALAKLVLGAIA